MAFINIATQTTLAIMKANVRSQSGTIVSQYSGLIEPQLEDICHLSIQFIRNYLGKFLDQFYSTTVTVTEASNLINISTTDIADANRLLLYDATHGKISIISETEFYGFLTLYSTTQLADAVFASISNILDTDNRLSLKTYRGTNKTTPGVLTFVYPRNPKKAADTDKLDLPEAYVPVAVDLATTMVFRKIEHKPPIEVEGRVTEFIKSQAVSLGLKVTPSTK